MPFSPINFLIDRRKTKPKSTEDELAVIKAAAWAWYERGSGSEGKPIREFDFTNSRRNPTPSRYKIEAMMNKATNDENSWLKTSTASIISISSCPSYNSSLMDNYEIESISKDLHHYIESCDDDSSARVGHGHGSGGHHGRVSKIEKGEVVSSKVKSKKLSKGGFLSRHAAVCGSLNDVVTGGHRNNIVVGIKGRRQPEKRDPMVNSSNPLPARVPHAS
ncbi:Tetratricopeptide repeat superfamily protein [Heracleum sosnowskyi]|uniref:Tetratricopeptide repeat superfamily protein n=1 Tax=Heracleum sosnowskyi TaxID=360622 RepID=A0AAD8M5T7_9APIA|nr:Tetratricopeptide repeat superfamily protein [Heracleum sosnowskyi]